jgi:hypothetical protein
LTASVVADGRLFVCSKQTQTVHCRDAGTGKPLWQFTPAGRVDSPPTICDGLCIFGCGDGSVYCLKASDGQLVWRFVAAPIDRRVVAESRLESVWPIHGSVLVQQGVVYAAAGRSSYLDGGIHLIGIDARSGKELYRTRVASEPIRPGKPRAVERMTEALPDILVSDGRRINMRQVQFDNKLVQFEAAELTTLFATTGLLEDLWAHRQSWSLGHWGKINSRTHAGRLSSQGRIGPAPQGQLLAFDGQCVYGAVNPYTTLKHTPSLFPASHNGHLHQKYSRYEGSRFPIGTRVFARPGTPVSEPAEPKTRRRGKPAPRPPANRWVVEAPLQPRAMLLAGDRLFLAGWLDALGIREKTGRAIEDDGVRTRPAVLRVLSTADGKQLAQYQLNGKPVFDGMSAARGRLFVSLKNGAVLCMGAGR